MPGRKPRQHSESTLETLNIFYTSNGYPDYSDRMLLAEETGESEARIMSWFKGRRQRDLKKGIPVAGSSCKSRRKGQRKNSKSSPKKNSKKAPKEKSKAISAVHSTMSNENLDLPPVLKPQKSCNNSRMMHDGNDISAPKLQLPTSCDTIGSQDLYLGMERREGIEMSAGDANSCTHKSTKPRQAGDTFPSPHPCFTSSKSTHSQSSSIGNTSASASANYNNNCNSAAYADPNWQCTSGTDPYSQCTTKTSTYPQCTTSTSPFFQSTVTTNPNIQCAGTNSYSQCSTSANSSAQCSSTYPQSRGQVNQIAEYWQAGDHQRALTIIQQQMYEPVPSCHFADNQPGYSVHQPFFTGPPYCPPYCFTMPMFSPYTGMPHCTMSSSWPQAIQPWWPVQPRNLYTSIGMNSASGPTVYNQPPLTSQSCGLSGCQPSGPKFQAPGPAIQPCPTIQQFEPVSSLQSQLPGTFSDNSTMQHSVNYMGMNNEISSSSSLFCGNNQTQSNTMSMNNFNSTNSLWNYPGQTSKQNNALCSSNCSNNLEQTKLPDFATSFGHQDSHKSQSQHRNDHQVDDNYLHTLSDVALSRQNYNTTIQYQQL